MRFRPLLPIVLALAGAPLARAQSLVCPTTPSGRACDTTHYHVAMYRPDNRTFVEVFGINQFASESACERARAAAIRGNEAVAAFLRQKDQQYQPDRFGPCHCDMTIDKGSPNFLSDLQRIAQVRQAEEIRQRVRERLLDRDVPTGSELVRGLDPPPAITPFLGGPRLVPPPAVTSVTSASNAPNDLKLTKANEATTTATTSVDLPLVEIPAGGEPPPSLGTVALPAPTPATTPSQVLPEERIAADQPAPASAPVPAPVPSTAAAPPEPQAIDAPPPSSPAPPAVAPQSTASQPPVLPAEAEPQPDDTAEAFIGTESERIQSVLKASGAIGDEAIRAKIFEACMQRIQLLSNLRSLIAGSGARSRLAVAVRNVHSEADRLAIVAALFGSDMPKHWAPADAKDVILEPMPEIENDPEKILRDGSGRWTLTQRKRALYVVLARSQPTEEQQLWLGSVIDAFLQ
jgi:hypothetical protein